MKHLSTDPDANALIQWATPTMTVLEPVDKPPIDGEFLVSSLAVLTPAQFVALVEADVRIVTADGWDTRLQNGFGEIHWKLMKTILPFIRTIQETTLKKLAVIMSESAGLPAPQPRSEVTPGRRRVTPETVTKLADEIQKLSTPDYPSPIRSVPPPAPPPLDDGQDDDPADPRAPINIIDGEGYRGPIPSATPAADTEGGDTENGQQKENAPDDPAEGKGEVLSEAAAGVGAPVAAPFVPVVPAKRRPGRPAK